MLSYLGLLSRLSLSSPLDFRAFRIINSSILDITDDVQKHVYTTA